MPAIAVITPFLNAEPHLAAAIKSVVDQTISDWELLLIDDGSIDRSGEIAAAAAAADPRIRLLSAGGQGAAAARNLGVSQARAPIIAFLDADDLYEPAKLAVDLDVLVKHPQAAMVYGPTLWWRDGPSHWQWEEPMRQEAGSVHAPPILVRKVILANDWHVPCTCSVSIRREAIIEVGGFEEQFRLYEDQSLWAKIFMSYPVVVQGRCLSRYRQHEQSVSSAASTDGQYDRMAPHSARVDFLAWLEQRLRLHGQDSKMERALRLAKAPYGGKGVQYRIDLLELFLRRVRRKASGRISRLMRALQFGRFAR